MNQFHLIAILAGLALPLQVAFNNKLSAFSGNPTTASLISFSVGTIALLVYNVANASAFQRSLQQVGQAPSYAWFGGIVGALYILSTVVASPRIGMATFLALVIGGQLLMSMVIDHFGLLGMPVKPINVWKCAGLLFTLIGVMLLKK